MTSLVLPRYAPAVAITLLLAAGWFCHRTQVNEARHAGYNAAAADYRAAQEIEAGKARAKEQRDRAASDEASQRWEKDRAQLQSEIDHLVGSQRVSVRMCRPVAAAASVRPASADPGESFDAASGPIDALQARPDIGGALVLYAGECERYRQQLKSLQEWVKSSTASPADQ